VLEGPVLAHLVTLEPDGRPQVSIVWIGLDGDALVAAHLLEHRKVRNIRRDPRVALSVEAGTRNEIYEHADPVLKEQAAARRLAPLGVKPGRYHPTDALLAFLQDL
jgi:PPOX class probable F420-dependent enzyme